MVGRSRSPWRVVVGGSSRSRTAALCVRRRPGDRAWATRVWIRIPRGAIRVARARRGRKASRARTLARGAAAGGRQRAEPAVWVGVAFGPEGRTAGPPRRGCCSRRRRVDAACAGAGAKGSIARVASAPREPRSWLQSFSPPNTFPRSSRKPLGAGDTRATVSPRALGRADLDHACDANGFEIPILTGAPRALRACGDPRTPKANLGEVTSVRSVASSEKKFNSGESLRGARREDDDDLAPRPRAYPRRNRGRG